MTKKYWLTPPELYKELNDKYQFDFDPCPYPTSQANALDIEWGNSNFVNPPFRIKDSIDGRGPTFFVRKAIAESKNGKSSLLLLPVRHYINLLLEAGAVIESLGRVRWLETETAEPWNSPVPIASFYLAGKK